MHSRKRDFRLYPRVKRSEPVIPFEDYGFSAEDYRAWRESVLHGGPEPDTETVERIRRWNEDTWDLRQEKAGAKVERHRQVWYGIWSVVGIVSLMVLTAGFTISWHISASNRTLAFMGIVGLVGGMASLAGRDFFRRR